MNPQGAGEQNNPFLQTIMGMRNGGQGGGNPMASKAIAAPPQMPQPGGMQGPGALAQAIQQGANAGPGGMTGGGGAAAKAAQPSNVPGGNPGSTDSLIKALGAMNQVITSTDDNQEISDARQIILILQQMIQRDQTKQGGKESALGQAQQSVAAYPPQQLQAPGGSLPPGGGQPLGAQT